MGCCVSKKRSEPPGAGAGEAHRRKVVEARDLPPPEEEKVKEVLSETPRVKPRPKPRRVAGALVAPASEKPNAKDGGARAKEGGVGRPHRAPRPARSIEEKSEAASESSAATTMTGPERSPSKPPRCSRQGSVSSEPRRARRDRAAAGPGGRASPSPPPPRREPGRRSPSPAAKRAQDQRRDTAASCAQRKPPVPARPCVRAPTPRRAQDAPSQPSPAQRLEPTHGASPPTPDASVQENTPASSDAGGGAGGGDGEGKESLENPLVSMECFIFL